MSEELSELRVDLQATASYVRDRVTECADTFDFDEAAGVLEDLDRVLDAVNLARDMITQELLRQLEAGDRSSGGRNFHRKPKTVQRFDHDYIAQAVYDQALERAKDDPIVAASQAVDTMRDLYVTDSTKAKVAVIEKLGLDKRKARSFKPTGGYELEILE